jgi:hypothetical protein
LNERGAGNERIRAMKAEEKGYRRRKTEREIKK